MRSTRKVSRQPRETFAVVVDGKCEVWYLQMLKRNERSLNINIEPKIPQRKKLKDQFEKIEQLAEDYTKVFWIVDYDVIKNSEEAMEQNFIQYRAKLRARSNVKVIINNPCLEFWFLLHFEATSKNFSNCSMVIRDLKKYLKDYQKTQKYFTKQNNDIYLRLKPYLEKALNNASKLGKFEVGQSNRALAEMKLFFKLIKVSK